MNDFDGLMREFEQATYEMTKLGLADVSGADMYASIPAPTPLLFVHSLHGMHRIATSKRSECFPCVVSPFVLRRYFQQASNLYLRLESALRDSEELNRCRTILGQEKVRLCLLTFA